MFSSFVNGFITFLYKLPSFSPLFYKICHNAALFYVYFSTLFHFRTI